MLPPKRDFIQNLAVGESEVVRQKSGSSEGITSCGEISPSPTK